MRDALTAALAVAGTAGLVACCVGFARMRDVFDRVHYANAASTLPPVLFAAAVLLDSGWRSSGMTALLVAFFTFMFGPMVAHAMARLARLRRIGTLEPTPDERERGR